MTPKAVGVRGRVGDDNSIETPLRVTFGEGEKLLKIAGIIFCGKPQNIVTLIGRHPPHSGENRSIGRNEPDEITLCETERASEEQSS
jgi:hypothetical protein